jgi:hypothetical protein
MGECVDAPTRRNNGGWGDLAGFSIPAAVGAFRDFG